MIDCTSEVILVYFVVSAILLSAIFLNIEMSNYNFQIFLLLGCTDWIFSPCTLNSAETWYMLSLKKPHPFSEKSSFKKNKPKPQPKKQQKTPPPKTTTTKTPANPGYAFARKT